MPGLDVEDFYESDSSDNDESHSKLVSSIAQLDSSQRIQPPKRREIALEISEHTLTEGTGDKKKLIDLKELAQTLNNKSEHVALRKKFEKISKISKTLPKPLEKTTEEKLKRSVGFEKVKKQLNRWDAIVTRNALADRLTFPLNDSSLKWQDTKEFLTQFKNKTPLEEEMAKVLKEDIENGDDKEEEENEFPLTFEEMLEKRKEMAQMRAKLFYKQLKAQRQNKIKSKKYHRLLKREKIRQQLKEFEILQKTDPEAALKKLAELDKTRAQERASLRHRNTGLWARNLTVRAKYDVETRKVLADQLKMSRELTQKVTQPADESDGEEADESLEPVPFVEPPKDSFGENPWNLDVSQEVKEFASGYRKFWSERKDENAIETSSNGLEGDTHAVEASTDTEKRKESKESEKKMDFKDLKQNEERKDSKDCGKSTKKRMPGEESEERKESKERKKVCKKNVERSKSKESEKSTKKKIPGEEIEERKESKESKKAAKKNEESVKSKESKKASKRSEESVSPRESEKRLQGKISPKKEKPVASPKVKTSVSIQPTSGVWIVTPAPEVIEPTPEVDQKRKRRADIDSLFEELNETLMKKAEKKAKKVSRELKKLESKKEKKPKTIPEESSELSFQSRNIRRPEMDSGLLEGGEEGFTEPSPVKPLNGDARKPLEASIDPKDFIQVKPKRLRTCLPDSEVGNDDALDDDEQQQILMEEAFGDDDVVAEFDEMKKKEEDSSKVEIDTTLPGWGSWTGSGIKPKRKKHLLVLNLPPRKDKLKKDLIINENENPNLRNHLVKEVPHPFKGVDAFESYIRAPIGREWVPETAHQKLIESPVVTKLGAVIEPMNKDSIVRLNKSPKSPFQGKKKKNK